VVFITVLGICLRARNRTNTVNGCQVLLGDVHFSEIGGWDCADVDQRAERHWSTSAIGNGRLPVTGVFSSSNTKSSLAMEEESLLEGSQNEGRTYVAVMLSAIREVLTQRSEA
jgi:hypothetical protein